MFKTKSNYKIPNSNKKIEIQEEKVFFLSSSVFPSSVFFCEIAEKKSWINFFKFLLEFFSFPPFIVILQSVVLF
jgi:hypothetical protein